MRREVREGITTPRLELGLFRALRGERQRELVLAWRAGDALSGKAALGYSGPYGYDASRFERNAQSTGPSDDAGEAQR